MTFASRHLALRARLGDLVDISAGVYADDVDGFREGVESETQLRVRQANLNRIVDRAGTIVDRHSP
jgi:hypothetical protein